jgi:hypothetical protein
MISKYKIDITGNNSTSVSLERETFQFNCTPAPQSGASRHPYPRLAAGSIEMTNPIAIHLHGECCERMNKRQETTERKCGSKRIGKPPFKAIDLYTATRRKTRLDFHQEEKRSAEHDITTQTHSHTHAHLMQDNTNKQNKQLPKRRSMEREQGAERTNGKRKGGT